MLVGDVHNAFEKQSPGAGLRLQAAVFSLTGAPSSMYKCLQRPDQLPDAEGAVRDLTHSCLAQDAVFRCT